MCPYPRRILAVSFKVDAARNLRERVRRRSGPQLAARFDSFTFHAFAKRLIDNFRPALTGYNALDPDYRIDPETRFRAEQITFADFVPLALEILENNAMPAEVSARRTATSSSTSSRTAPTSSTQLIKAAFGHGRHRSPQSATPSSGSWRGPVRWTVSCAPSQTTSPPAPLPLYQNFRLRTTSATDAEPHDHADGSAAASPDEDLVGDDGIIEVLHFDTESTKQTPRRSHRDWLAEGAPPSEIAILVRQQSNR